MLQAERSQDYNGDRYHIATLCVFYNTLQGDEGAKVLTTIPNAPGSSMATDLSCGTSLHVISVIKVKQRFSHRSFPRARKSLQMPGFFFFDLF